MSGKTAILTGVTGGWGRAVLDRFLDRGWSVCATTRGETGLPDGVLVAEADLTDADSARRRSSTPRSSGSAGSTRWPASPAGSPLPARCTSSRSTSGASSWPSIWTRPT